jgi:hypothetical protein
VAESNKIREHRKTLEDLIPDAISAIADVMAEPKRNAKARLEAAKTILDRAGLPAVAASQVKFDGTLDGPGTAPQKVVIEIVRAEVK